MLAALKENAEQNGIVNPRIAQVEVELAAIEREESTRKQQLQAEEYTNTWRSKLEQSITTAGLDPKDERFDDVWENFDLHYRLDGQFEFTEKKLARALKGVKVETKETKPPVDETKKLVETEITKRLAEAKREWMKQYGIVETEVAQPSAQSASDRKIRDNYIANPNDPNAKQAYMAYRARQGL